MKLLQNFTEEYSENKKEREGKRWCVCGGELQY